MVDRLDNEWDGAEAGKNRNELSPGPKAPLCRPSRRFDHLVNHVARDEHTRKGLPYEAVECAEN